MAVRNLLVNADTHIIDSYPNLNSGSGTDLRVGRRGSFSPASTYRSLLKFTLDWTDVASITSAVLWMHTDSAGWEGSSPNQLIQRITSAWTEAGATWNNQPSTTTADQVTADLANPGPVFGVWDSVDITNIVKAWAPTSIPGGGNQANNGIMLKEVSTSVSDAATFDSREDAYDPYIVLTYASNSAPTAPTLNSPANGATVTGASAPVLNFTPHDPNGDVHTKYHYQVDNNADFSSPLASDDVDVAGSFTDNVAVNRTVQSSLSRGTTYYWRVKTFDGSLWGPYSAARSFVVNSLPVATLLTPNDATGKVAKMVFTPGSGWTAPRMEVAWSYSDVQGQAQTQYELEIITDNAGAPTGTTKVSGAVASSATDVIPAPATDYAENTRYHVRVRAYDGLEWGAWSGFFICRARWGLTTHRKDVNISGAAPAAWAVTALDVAVGATSAITLEYNSSDDGTTNLGAWKSDLSLVTKRKFVHYRAWLFGWGASPATRPQLLDITIQASGFTAQPDFWLPSPISGEGGSIDKGKFAFGTQSLKMTGDGTEQLIRTQVRVEPNTLYMFQGRIENIGNSGADIRLADSATGAAIFNLLGAPLSVDASMAQYVNGPWNSGGRTAVWIQCRINGSSSTAAFFDAIQLEKGTVATGYRPSPLGSAAGSTGAPAVVDSGGVQIDAAAGGVFRLRGSGGGARDIIELGTNGLKFGGDTEFYNYTAGTMVIQAPAGAAGVLAVRAAAGQRARVDLQETGDTNLRALLWGDATLTGLELGPGNASPDTNLYRGGANLLKTDDSLEVAGNSKVTGALQVGAPTTAITGAIALKERAGIGNAPTDEGVLYLRDNGSGKTQLVVVFQSGVTQVLATEP